MVIFAMKGPRVRWKTLTGIGIGLAATVALLWKGVANSRRLQLTEETVALPTLPAAFDGFRLLQLSDLHLRRHGDVGPMLLELIARIDPDLICLTGDYAFTALSVEEVDRFLQALGNRPVAAVYGNADFRPGISYEERARWATYVPFLANSALCLAHGDETLWVAGVDDPHHGRDSLPHALAPVPSDACVILLAHSPEVILRALDPRVRLILCGHTHGGQICLPGGRALYLNTPMAAKYASGRHQLAGATLYVSRGIGSTRLPLRYGCLPEITVFTLTRGGEDASGGA